MRQSQLFSKADYHDPKDETALNAKLLMRGGFISKVMSGVYEFLPLGYRVLKRINHIIREEMNATGAEELHLSVLQNKETWEKTGRWESAKDIMYQFADAYGKEVGLGWTHEEPLSSIATHFISSYKDLPRAVYQIQTKFRNEPRAKSGLLRGREFLMKDLYSFHASEEDLNKYYERVAEAYTNIFSRCGLDSIRTLASGGLFSQYSDEFQVISEVGEDTIYTCGECTYAANKEVAGDVGIADSCPLCGGDIKEKKSIEVGNTFKLGTKFSEAFGLLYSDEDGEKKPVLMASYGIGPGRLMGTIVETHHDRHGLMWPKTVAPYAVHVLALGEASADDIYKELERKGIEVLYDDRDISAGEKLIESDLLGIPARLVVSPKTGAKIELKERNKQDTVLVEKHELMQTLKKIL